MDEKQKTPRESGANEFQRPNDTAPRVLLRADEIRKSIDPAVFYPAELPDAPPLKRTRGAWSQNIRCPFHDDSEGSFGVNLDTGAYHCFGCNADGGSIVDFTMARHGLDFDQAREQLATEWNIAPAGHSRPAGPARDRPAPPPRPTAKAPAETTKRPIFPIPAEALAIRPQVHPQHGKPAGEWIYHDAAGAALFVVDRFDLPDQRKQFAPLTYWRDGWHWQGPPVPRPLYNLDKLAARPDDPVVVCEGEKAADAAGRLLPEMVTITTSGGAQAPAKTDFSPLRGRRVFIWPDRDEPGAKYAVNVAELARAAGAETVAILDLASLATDPATGEPRELAKGWDAADAASDGWTPEALAAAVRWLPATAAASEQRSPPPPHPEVRPRANAPQEPRDPSAGEPLAPYFEETDTGLYYWSITRDKDGNPKRGPRVRVCSPIWIRARTRTLDEDQYGRLVELRNPDGNLVRLNVPYALLRGSGEELRGLLFNLGLEIGTHRDAFRLLVDYFKGSDPSGWARCTNRTGWQGEPGAVFVLPDATLGSAGEPWIFQEEGARVVHLGTAGSLADWRDQVAKLCQGNSRLVFALCAVFAAPLLALVGEESGGFHLFGESTNPSSVGKTTIFRVTASAMGAPEYLKGHRATDNGLEAPARQHTDLCLLLDDLNQADPKKAGPVVYMLAGESEKIRGARSGGSREIKTWRLLFLSNGEATLVNYMRLAGIEPTAGALVRMPDIPSDGGAGFGCFENLHNFEDARTFAKTLKERSAKYYGTAGPAFIERIIDHRADLLEGIKRTRDQWTREALGGRGEVAAPVGRVADRFSLLAVAGELATAWGITGWTQGEAYRAVRRCFHDWLKERGGVGNLEEERILANVRHFIELNGDAQFVDWERAERRDDHRPKTSNAAGFSRYRYDPQPTRYYLLPERFRREVCRPHAWRDVERVLLRAGWLIPSGENPPRPTRTERLPIFGKQRCYVIEIPEEPGSADAAAPPPRGA